METKVIVLEVLKKEGNPMSAGQITEISGLDRKEVDKAMKLLKDEELIVSPKRCYWEAKKGQKVIVYRIKHRKEAYR